MLAAALGSGVASPDMTVTVIGVGEIETVTCVALTAAGIGSGVEEDTELGAPGV